MKKDPPNHNPPQKEDGSPRKVFVLYNCDFDPSPPPRGVARRDRSDVARAAHEVRDALGLAGFEPDILGIGGPDLTSCLERIRKSAPDLVFNLTESLAQRSVNEVVMPAVLQMLGVPFTGSGSLALALCLNKPKAKDILRARGVPTPASCTVERAQDAANVDLPFPLFVKPSQEDASVGIKNESVVQDRRSLVKRVRELLDEVQQPVLIERYVEGRELNITLLGNDPVTVLPFHEIDFSQLPEGHPRIVSYAAKWDQSSPEYAGTVPILASDMAEGCRLSIERCAVSAFRALDLQDYGRVDFRLAEDGTPFVIDVNPNCDISPGAGVARAALAEGMEYPHLIRRICEIAWERHANADSKARAA
ncbi:MAG: ATP-grasp domain-containing protein [Pseudomonadota bacterium]